MTCALLFVPATLVKSCALSVILAPGVATVQFEEASQRLIDQARTGEKIDPKSLEELTRTGANASGTLASGFVVFLLGLLGTLVTAFFLYGIVVPLTNGALTIAVADRILGGNAGWREVWMLLFRRLGKLLATVIPAALLVALGFVLFVIPGLILSFLFAFVSPVVLIEGIGGKAALKRSSDLVRSDWVRVAVVLIVFGVIRWFAQMLANLFIPSSAVFIASLFGDLFTMVLLPIPVLGAVLLYFDIRRKRDAFDNGRLRAELDALKAGS